MMYSLLEIVYIIKYDMYDIISMHISGPETASAACYLISIQLIASNIIDI